MDNFQKLLNNAYRFLSYRPRSIKEVEDYLKKKKANDLEIKKIVDKLKEQRFLDDAEFARLWIEQRSTVNPKSSRVIKMELKQKGIPRELIEEVLDSSTNLKTDLDKAFALAEKRVSRLKNLEPRKAYERLARFLAGKGFDWDTIKEVLNKTLKQ